MKDNWSLPIGHQRAEDHQGIFHQGDDFTSSITFQEQFTTRFEHAELKVLIAPISNHLIQFRFDIFFFDGRDTDILRRNETITLSFCSPLRALTSMSSLYFKSGAAMMSRRRKLSDSMSNLCPVTVAIRSQWRGFIDLFAIISSNGQVSLKSSTTARSIVFVSYLHFGSRLTDCLFQFFEGVVFFQTFGQLSATVLEVQQIVVDLFDVDFDPGDVIVAIDCINDDVVETVEFL
jgi:hypothetical protein